MAHATNVFAADGQARVPAPAHVHQADADRGAVLALVEAEVERINFEELIPVTVDHGGNGRMHAERTDRRQPAIDIEVGASRSAAHGRDREAANTALSVYQIF